MTIKALQVRGPFHGPSGYEHHVREFVRELDRAGIAVQLIDFPEWCPVRLPAEMQDPWFDSLSKPVEATVSLQFCMPNQVIHYPETVIVNYTMFEATRIPYDWVEVSERCHLTVLPTESSRFAWIESGAPVDRLRLCPLGLRSSLFAAPVAPLEIPLSTGRRFSDYAVRFLNVSAVDSRKNFEGLLRCWLRATTPADDAALLVKLGCYQPASRHVTKWFIRLAQAATGKTLAEAAPVHLMFDLVADEEMPRLYAAATHYISVSHGEGWDLPMMEAIGSGLTPIAPDHSAYQSYLDRTVAHLIPSHEVSPMRWYGANPESLFAGATFWDPDDDYTVDLIRSIIDSGIAPPASARDRVLGEYTWERATRRLIEILDEAESLAFSSPA